MKLPHYSNHTYEVKMNNGLTYRFEMSYAELIKFEMRKWKRI